MKDRNRRNLGSALGLAAGLVYGVTSYHVNPWLLSNIPLYQPFLGQFLSILSFTICGAVTGSVMSWSKNSLRCLAIGAAIGGLLSTCISIFIVSRGAQNQIGILRFIFVYWLPRTIILLGFGWLFQQVIKIWENELKSVMFSIPKMIRPLLGLLVVAFLLGLLSIYPKNGRYALNQTQALIQTGLMAEDYTQLPPVLLPVDGFLEKAQGRFTLQLSDNPYRLPFQPPIGTAGKQSYVVLVRFENSFRFACAYIVPNPQPACGEY